MTANELRTALKGSEGTAALESLYGGGFTPDAPEELERQQQRYLALVNRFDSTFPGRSGLKLFSAPGRTEICGNHTDHNGGRVLAAAVAHDAIAVAAPSADGVVTIESEGYPRQSINLEDLARRESEMSAAIALTRGVLARFKSIGRNVGGFCASVTSNVLKGSGLSSSAAYEVLVGTILNHLFNQGAVEALQIALIAQYSENEYFGKPCGLMDQTTSAVGGFVTIDFKNFAHPMVQGVSLEFAGSGYVPVLVDTGGSHADLTDDYAAVKKEMKDVARCLGGTVLSDTTRERMLAELPRVRKQAGDRAVLRALHFFADDERVVQEVEALEAGRFEAFLKLVRDSGRSSWMLLQNCYSPRTPREQGVPLALSLSEAVLGDAGGWRVHGGGFAGTILAFVPEQKLEEYLDTMRPVFGAGSCHVLSIRSTGAVMLPL